MLLSSQPRPHHIQTPTIRQEEPPPTFPLVAAAPTTARVGRVPRLRASRFPQRHQQTSQATTAPPPPPPLRDTTRFACHVIKDALKKRPKRCPLFGTLGQCFLTGPEGKPGGEVLTPHFCCTFDKFASHFRHKFCQLFATVFVTTFNRLSLDLREKMC